MPKINQFYRPNENEFCFLAFFSNETLWKQAISREKQVARISLFNQAEFKIIFFILDVNYPKRSA